MRWLSIGARTEHPGSVRVDIRSVADVVADVCRLPFADGSFEGVECFHVLEHLLPDGARVALSELYRVCRLGGDVEIAVPDLLACARTLLSGNEQVLLNIYSPDPQEAQQHRWGYTPRSLVELLRPRLRQLRQMPSHPLDPHEMRFVGRLE